MAGTSRVAVTEKAAEMIRRLRDQHGPLMFHQSGGCCDGSSPMCFAQGDFITGDSDELLVQIDAGTPEPIDVWMSKEQFAYWRHTHLTIDLVPGRGAGFSLDGPTRFPVPDPVPVVQRRGVGRAGQSGKGGPQVRQSGLSATGSTA